MLKSAATMTVRASVFLTAANIHACICIKYLHYLAAMHYYGVKAVPFAATAARPPSTPRGVQRCAKTVPLREVEAAWLGLSDPLECCTVEELLGMLRAGIFRPIRPHHSIPRSSRTSRAGDVRATSSSPKGISLSYPDHLSISHPRGPGCVAQARP